MNLNVGFPEIDEHGQLEKGRKTGCKSVQRDLKIAQVQNLFKQECRLMDLPDLLPFNTASLS